MTTFCKFGGGSGGDLMLVKTPHTTGSIDRYFDIKGYKKLFWSIDNTNPEDNCWITVALVSESGSQQNLFAGNLGQGGRNGIIEVGSNKQIRFYKAGTRYTTVSFTCVATNNEDLINRY